MALRLNPSAMLSSMFPRLSLSSIAAPSSPRWSLFSSRSPALLYSLLRPTTLSITIPDFLSDIWEGILRAAPKKKVSHMKRRHRQLAGKALKDVKNFVACPGCGELKRSHVLCSTCIENIKKQWKETKPAT